MHLYEPSREAMELHNRCNTSFWSSMPTKEALALLNTPGYSLDGPPWEPSASRPAKPLIGMPRTPCVQCQGFGCEHCNKTGVQS